MFLELSISIFGSLFLLSVVKICLILPKWLFFFLSKKLKKKLVNPKLNFTDHNAKICMFVNSKSYASIFVPPMLSFFCLSCQADTIVFHTIWLSPTMCIICSLKYQLIWVIYSMGSMSIHFLDSESQNISTGWQIVRD